MRELIKKMTPDFLKSLYRLLREVFIRIEFKIYRLLPIAGNRVVFCNVWGYGDNPKWIAEALCRGDKRAEIIFICNNAAAAEKQCEYSIKFAENNSPLAIKYLATARVWVDCNRKEPYISKRPGQFYLQTWHGSIPLKKIEGDCEALSEKYLANAYRDSAMTNVYISNGSFCNELYRRAFKFDYRITAYGSARLDPLLNPNADRIIKLKKKILSTLEEQSGEFKGLKYDDIKIAVYAPTYRNGESGFVPAGFENAEAVIAALEERFGGRFILVDRLHPLTAAAVKKVANPRVVDGNSFGDLYAVLEAAEVLITDYSNTLFEFALCKKPVFLFAPDSKEYQSARGMYFNYDELPYPHSESEAALIEAVVAYRPDEYIEKQQSFFDSLGIIEEGTAADKIATMIVKELNS